MKYYYRNSSNEVVGPIQFADLANLADADVIDAQTPVLQEGTTDWTRFGQIQAAANVAGGTPPPPVPAAMPPPPAPPLPPPPPTPQPPSSNSRAMKYFYANTANEPIGPIESQELARLAIVGSINDETHVIPEGGEAWTTYGEIRSSLSGPVGGPPPPPAPTPRPKLGRGALISLIAAAAAVALAVGGLVLWRTVLNRPASKLIGDYVSAELGQRGLRMESLKSVSKSTGSNQVEVTYTAEAVTTAPLYAPVDTPSYLRAQFGYDPSKFSNAEAEASNIDPAELASIGNAPTDPTSVTIVKLATRSGSTFTYTGSLLGTRGDKTWGFTDVAPGQFQPQEPQGTPRADIQGETYVADDPTDISTLKALVDKANTYANQIAHATPTGLPASAKTIVKLAKAGAGEDAMMDEVHTLNAPVPLTATQVLYLTNAGVPQDIVKLLIQGPPPPAPEQNASPSNALAGSPNIAYSSQEASPAPEPSAPPPPAPTVVSIGVPPNIPWFDTGIDLGAGIQVAAQANGYVTVHAQPPLPISASLFGRAITTTVPNQTPDGTPSASSENPFHPYVAPGLPAYSLVAKIGDSAPFEIGSNSTFTTALSGRLFLSVNADSFDENVGNWNVTLTYSAGGPPPEMPAQVSFDYFHDQLSPYGNWVQIPGYGWCWSPSVAGANPGWRPYFDDGQWVFTDTGLYWQSAYPWGDIAFHYGRWYLDPNYGWLWVPGYDWAPSWVAWRYANAYGAIGWAPLPPGAIFIAGVGLQWNGVLAVDADFGLGPDAFVFINASHFWDRDFRFYAFGRDRIGFFYGRSFIRNGYRFDHGRFLVEGIGRDRLGAFTHHAIRVERASDIRAHEERAHFDARRPNISNRGPSRQEFNFRNEPGRGPANNGRPAPAKRKAPPPPPPKKKPNS